MPGMARYLALLAVCALAPAACALDTEGRVAGLDDADASFGGSSGLGGSGAGSAASAGAGGGAGSSGGGGGDAGVDAGGAAGSGGLPNLDGGGEDCLDGLDNDGDTLIDCADPECAPGYQCVPAAPLGWIGYARTRGDVYGAPEGPPCTDGGAPTRYSSSPAGGPQCSACSCGPLTGATCGTAPIWCFPGSSSCGGTAEDWTGKFADGQCHGGPGSINSLSCKLGPIPVTNPGTCTPSASDFANKDPFLGATDVCRFQSQPGGGCGASEVCIPRGAGDYAGYVCVELPGDQVCPTGWGAKAVGYTGMTDTRACGACSCTVQAVSCAGAEYGFWDGGLCDLDSEKVGSEQCKDVSGLTDFDLWSYRRTKLPGAGGSCAPSGGQPQGSVYPTGAITFCCRN